jgi:hypothetical protein
VCQCPSPRSPSDPADGCTEAPILGRLEEGQEDQGIAAYGGARGSHFEGLGHPLLEGARNVEGEGAARSPRSPINGARTFEAVVPRASSAQTSADQETLPIRSASTDLKPGRISNPAVKSRSRISIAVGCQGPVRVSWLRSREPANRDRTTEGTALV